MNIPDLNYMINTPTFWLGVFGIIILGVAFIFWRFSKLISVILMVFGLIMVLYSLYRLGHYLGLYSFLIILIPYSKQQMKNINGFKPRPPKKWMTKFRHTRNFNLRYGKMSIEKQNKILAGIFHKYKPSLRRILIIKYAGE